ncbi:MAG: SLATT domain-containing protein [Candidatus Thiodiazotropha sp.]
MSVERILETLEKWHKRIRATHKGHYKDAARLAANQHRLGILVVIITSIVGTGVFASLSTNNPATWMKVVTGALSLTAVVLSALQAYLNYPAKQVTHVLAATKLSSLKKRIEEQITIGGDEDELKAFLREIRTEWDSITHGAPLMSDDTYSNTSKPMVTAAEFDFSDESFEAEIEKP